MPSVVVIVAAVVTALMMKSIAIGAVIVTVIMVSAVGRLLLRVFTTKILSIMIAMFHLVMELSHQCWYYHYRWFTLVTFTV